MSNDGADEKRARARARSTRHYRRRRQDRLDSARRYREANPEKVREARRRSREKHGDKRRAEYRAWYRENRDACRMKDQARRALQASGAEEIPKDYVRMLLYIQSNECGACLCDLGSSGFHIDHVQAIARGGKHERGNLQLLCPHCNQSKGAKDFWDFMDEAGRLDSVLTEAHYARKQERIAKWYGL